VRLIVEADGGSRGNPGPAGYGALVRDAVSGEVLAETAASVGTTTNNVAEYRGLIAGLTQAAALAADADVEVRMDSKLVVEQMSGRWRIKHPDMKPLAMEARELASGFSSVRYTWIPRERNKHADRLANEAMDAAARGREWSPSASSSGSDEDEPERPSTGWGAPTGVATRTLLLRHGETPLSTEKRFAGIGEIPLTETGVLQAKAAARALAGRSIDAIVSSPLGRARQTAQEVADVLDLPVRTEDGLRETDFGDWEGYTFAEVRSRWPAELDSWLADPSVAPPHGESFTDVARRVNTARDKLLVRFRGQTVLVVSHVTPIKLLVRSALEAPPSSLYRMYLEVSSLSEIDWYSDGPAVLRLFNDTHHLG
jgi:ribonuclease H / adenosylcobalamin/alpha-ribazole phosphatase